MAPRRRRPRSAGREGAPFEIRWLLRAGAGRGSGSVGSRPGPLRCSARRRTVHTFCHAVPDRWHVTGLPRARGGRCAGCATRLARPTAVPTRRATPTTGCTARRPRPRARYRPTRRTARSPQRPRGASPLGAEGDGGDGPRGRAGGEDLRHVGRVRGGCGSFSSAAQAVLRRRQAGVLEGTWTRRGVVRRSGGGRWSAEGGGPYAVSELWVVALIGERQVQPGAPCADRRDQCRQAPSDDPAMGTARRVAAGTRPSARMMSSTTVTCGGVRGGGAREAVAMVIRRRTSTQQRASGRFSAASSGCRPS